MMSKSGPSEHLVFSMVAGALCTLIVLFSVAVALIRHAPIALADAWLAVGVFSPIFVLVCGFANDKNSGSESRRSIISVRCQWILITLLTITVAVLLWWSARKYAVVFGLAEATFVYGALAKRTRPFGWYFAVFIGALATWAFSLGFTYTPVANWLLNATGSSKLALPTFFIAFGIALYLVIPANASRARDARTVVILQFVFAVCAFIFLGLRVDNEASLWIPYHQSYFTSPAALVRAHHWLLWDVPSQYGFLSVLTLAAIPAATTFDALYFATAAILFIQATIVFAVFRLRRSGWANFVFAFLLCCATFYSSQAAYYPFGARLYPQEGLRFLWPTAALLFAFLRYQSTGTTTKKWAMALGYISWLLAVLWSFETGIWATIIWVSFLIGEVVETWLCSGVTIALRALATRLRPLLLLLLLTIVVIEFVYRGHFGHGPDWRGYVEFSAIYATSSQFVVPVDPFGPGWTIALVLIALASLAIVALRRRQYRALPVLFACWGAVWGTSSYYAAEAFNQHVAMLSGILIFVGAIVFWITESYLRRGLTPLLARLSFVPVSVLLIAYAFGAPTHMRDIRWPDTTELGSSLSRTLPTISGELLTLERNGHFRPNDEALYPSRANWNKVSNGFILPLERNANGAPIERVAWLPLSPAGEYNTLTTLPPTRRDVYIARYLADSANPQGWLIAYREPARCSGLSPQLKAIRRARTPNYNAAYCRLRTTAPIPDAPLLTSLPGGSIPPHSDYVRITYVTKSGQSPASAESINSLGPNALTVVHSPAPIMGAIGYNVYAVKNNGGSGKGETLQNSSPVPLGADYHEPPAGWTTGGQPPPTVNTAHLSSHVP